MRARFALDRDGNLIVTPLPAPRFEEQKSPPEPPCVDRAADPNVYDSAGHAIGNYI
jgi:hypothetical protein